MDPKFIQPAFIYATKGSRKTSNVKNDQHVKNKKYDTEHDDVILKPRPKRGAQGTQKPPMFGKRAPGFTPRQYWILSNLFDNSHTCGNMPKDHFLRLFHLVFAHRLLVIKSTNPHDVIPAGDILSAFEAADKRGFYFLSVDFKNPHHGTQQNIQQIRDKFVIKTPEKAVIREAQPRKTEFRNNHKIAPEENGSHGEATGWDDLDAPGRYPICGRMDCTACPHECYFCEDEFESCDDCKLYTFAKNHNRGPCTARRGGISSRIPLCGVLACTGCNLRCLQCALFPCAVCNIHNILQIGVCTADNEGITDPELSWAEVANAPVAGWAVIPEPVVDDHLVTSSLNGSHGEYTGSDDVANIDNALVQMANAQVFDNQPGIGRERREARNHQHRRPIQNRRADNPRREPRPLRIDANNEQWVDEPEQIPGDNDPARVVPPEIERPLRIAIVSNMEIPSMGIAEKPLYPLSILRLRNLGVFATAQYMLGSLVLKSKFLYGRSNILLLADALVNFAAPVAKYSLIACGALCAFRFWNIDLGRLGNMFGVQNVFTTMRFTRISPLRKILKKKSGPDSTHLALSGYTGVYRGNVYEQLVDPCVSKYGTGVFNDTKQGVVGQYMRELLKSTYPDTIVNQVTFANTVVYTTAAILELQNTISSHTSLLKATYASSSMM